MTGAVRWVVTEFGDTSLEDHMDYIVRTMDIGEFCTRWFREEPDACVPFSNILDGLMHTHGLGCLHRNLKPSNGNLADSYV